MYKILLLLFFLSGCTTSAELLNFNALEWKSDLFGCGNIRNKQITQVVAQKEALLGKSEKDILHLFGAPDKNELYGRNQKFFVYYTSPGPTCVTNNDSTSYLSIRGKASGVSSEVLHYSAPLQDKVE